ncbi:hypothetical protein S40288_10504 [Stachybotrys chartarum IBT 40288]|nr:hypothetical protein S40288_10504 [Stachybotrys chartarum IBT 40288]
MQASSTYSETNGTVPPDDDSATVDFTSSRQHPSHVRVTVAQPGVDIIHLAIRTVELEPAESTYETDTAEPSLTAVEYSRYFEGAHGEGVLLWRIAGGAPQPLPGWRSHDGEKQAVRREEDPYVGSQARVPVGGCSARASHDADPGVDAIFNRPIPTETKQSVAFHLDGSLPKKPAKGEQEGGTCSAAIQSHAQRRQHGIGSVIHENAISGIQSVSPQTRIAIPETTPPPGTKIRAKHAHLHIFERGQKTSHERRELPFQRPLDAHEPFDVAKEHQSVCYVRVPEVLLLIIHSTPPSSPSIPTSASHSPPPLFQIFGILHELVRWRLSPRAPTHAPGRIAADDVG